MKSKHGLATPFSSTTSYLASALRASKFEEETRVDVLSRLAAGGKGGNRRRMPRGRRAQSVSISFLFFLGAFSFCIFSDLQNTSATDLLPLCPKAGDPEASTAARYKKAYMDDEEAGLSTLCRRSNHNLRTPQRPGVALGCVRYSFCVCDSISHIK